MQDARHGTGLLEGHGSGSALGRRIVEVARLMAMAHLNGALTDAAADPGNAYGKQVKIGGAGPTVVTDDDALATAGGRLRA